MARRGLARNTIMRVRATLVLALSHAERRSHVARNVARLAEMPVNAKPAREGRSLTLAEARILLDAARSDPLEAVWVAGLMLGLRPGELTDCCGSRWTSRPPRCRCDDRSRTDRPGCVSVTRRPGVPFGASIYHRRWWRRLRRQQRRQKIQREIAGRAWVQYGLVFTTAVGTALDPANLRRSFSALTRDAGLGHWTPKELRHSAASLLSASGVPLELIADVMGHDGTRMTGAVYRHAVRPTVCAGAAAMSRMFE